MKIIDVIWFTQMGSLAPIGIVIGENEVTNERMAYIGSGFGNDERTDEKHIMDTGAKLRLPVLMRITAQLANNLGDKEGK